MILLDVNVLVYAFRSDLPEHAKVSRWLESQLAGDRPFAFSDMVASGFLRIVTNRHAFSNPDPMAAALQFVQTIRDLPNCVIVGPGPRHWSLFVKLCREVEAKGDLVPDTFFAALAIESGSEWITTDRDYARFPGLKWRHPIQD